MDGLPVELVDMIIGSTGLMTLPIVRCVCSQWHALACARTPAKGRGTLVRVRAIRYARRLIQKRRWGLLEWMLGCADIVRGISKVDTEACAVAASDGDLVRLQTLIRCGFRWDVKTTLAAARYGHCSILEWMHTQEVGDRVWNGRVGAAAVKGGHADVLKWLRSVDRPWGQGLCDEAAENGDLEMLMWLVESGYALDENGCCCGRAAAGGHLHVLKWLRERECTWDCVTMIGAAQGGHIDVLEWAHANGCPWGGYMEYTGTPASQRSYIEVMEWIRGKGLEQRWHRASREAAHHGYYDVLEWVDAHGAQFDVVVMLWAVGAGRLDVVQWLRARGCP